MKLYEYKNYYTFRSLHFFLLTRELIIKRGEGESEGLERRERVFEVHVEGLLRDASELEGERGLSPIDFIITLDELKVLHTRHRDTPLKVENVRGD